MGGKTETPEAYLHKTNAHIKYQTQEIQNNCLKPYNQFSFIFESVLEEPPKCEQTHFLDITKLPSMPHGFALVRLTHGYIPSQKCQCICYETMTFRSKVSIVT